MRLSNARPDSSSWRGRQPRPEPRGPRLPPRPSWMRGRGSCSARRTAVRSPDHTGGLGQCRSSDPGPGSVSARRAATLCRALCKRVRRAPRPRKRKNLPSFFHGLQVSYSLCDVPSPGHGVTHGAAAAPAAPVACSGCAHLSLLRPAPGLGSGRPQRPARQVSESPAPGAERELDRPACGSRRVPYTTQVSDGVTGHRRPQRPRGDSGRSSRARGPDAAPRAAPRGQRQSGLRRAMLAVSRR